MKNIFRKKGLYMAIATILTTGILVAAVPGSDEDPLISKSYIDEVLMPQIEAMVGDGAATPGEAFELVSLKSSQKLICEAGTELIIRMGNAKIIATEKGGIADVTDGYDLPAGAAAPANHHLIVPVADGRGLNASDNMIVMVKGGYKIK